MGSSIQHHSYLIKRFYTPPSRRTWSKQHPKFLTPRPLVHPYNLNRLHPEKEWWKLSNRKLHPVTFMGHPDPVSNDKLGGSIYAEQMDSSTLAIIMHRCIAKGVNNVYIWDKLIAQAKRLCIKMDTTAISYIYLYASKYGVMDNHFIGSFVGRVNALLPEFALIDCANIIKSMHNPHYLHTSTLVKVIGQAKNLLLARSDLSVKDSIAFLSSIAPFYSPPFTRNDDNVSGSSFIDNELLELLFDEIHVHIIDLVDKTLLLNAMASCHEIGLKTRYLHNYCRLPIEKIVNKLREGDFIGNVGLYTHLVKVVHLFNFGTLGTNLYDFVEKKCYLLNIDEICLFLWASSWDSQLPSSFKKLLVNRFIDQSTDKIVDKNLVLALIGLGSTGNFTQVAEKFCKINVDNLDTYHKLLLSRCLSQYNLPIKISVTDVIAKIKPTLPWHICKMSESLAKLSQSLLPSDVNLLDSPQNNLNHHDIVSLLVGLNPHDHWLNNQAQLLMKDIISGTLKAIKCSHTLLALALKCVNDPVLARQIIENFATLKWDTSVESFDDFKQYKPLVQEAMVKFGIQYSKAALKCNRL